MTGRAEDGRLFRAGAGRAVITPTLDDGRPIYLAGYGINRWATAIHDDLCARALALSLDGTGVLLIAVDVIGLEYDVAQEAIDELAPVAGAAGIPRDGIILVATHNHQGPDTIGLWGPTRLQTGVDPVAMERVRRGLVAAATEAAVGLTPARLRAAAVSHVDGVVHNARDPQILDDELVAVQVASAGDDGPGRPAPAIATVITFANHPEALGPDNTQITADFPAALYTAVEERAGGVALFLPGALGGMMTPLVGANTFAEAERIGRTLAGTALAALEAAAWQEQPRLLCRKRRLRLKQANPLFDLARAAGLLSRAVAPPPPGEIGYGLLDSEVNYLAIDDVELVTVPGELLPALGLALKQEMAAPVRGVVGLANDQIGYILPAEVFTFPDDPSNPGDHYEETMSLGRETGPAVMAAARALMQTGAGTAGRG